METSGVTQSKKRRHNELDDVTGDTINGFFPSFWRTIKRKLDKNSTSKHVDPLDGGLPTKKPRLDIEESEILDDSNLPSLVASGATTPVPSSINTVSHLELQSVDLPEIADSLESVGQCGPSPGQYDIFPIRRKESATREVRQTAIELWKNTSDNAEAVNGGPDEGGSAIIKLEYGDDTSNCFGVVAAKDGESAEATGHSSADKDGEVDNVVEISTTEQEHNAADVIVHTVEIQTASIDGRGGLLG